MKKIKLMLMSLIVCPILITSCNSSDVKESKSTEPIFNSEEGYVIVNKFGIDSLKFINSVKELKEEDKISSLIYMTCLFAESNCKNELTFKPLDAFILKNDGDTILVNLTFEAQNSYGVPGKLSAYVPFLNDEPLLETAIITEN